LAAGIFCADITATPTPLSTDMKCADPKPPPSR
jgi:hypothetical protein